MKKNKKLSHVGENNLAKMVDIGEKQVTERSATAQSIVEMPKKLAGLFKGEDLITKKGPVFNTAILAGTMAAKQTQSLIPLCHQIPLTSCEIKTKLKGKQILISCSVKTSSKTGVEMEALVGASITALTIYDMCKAISHKIKILETRLVSKTGGKHDFS